MNILRSTPVIAAPSSGACKVKLARPGCRPIWLNALQPVLTVIVLFLSGAWAARAQNSGFAVLYTFTGAGDGGVPSPAPIIRDQAGNFYGTTSKGGNPSCGLNSSGCGVVFKLSPTGTETPLFAFSGRAGASPYGGVKQDAVGNLYGTTELGGSGDGVDGDGVVFRVSPQGFETILHDFSYNQDGYGPVAGLIGDAEGNLYGTAPESSGSSESSYGVAFRIGPAGKYTVLHSFQGDPEEGAIPNAGLIRDPAGNLFGTTSSGGAGGLGTIFKIDGAGNLTTLHSFSGADGSSPSLSSLTFDIAGNIYGVTPQGGTSNQGVVFELSSTGTYTSLYNFKGGEDGSDPVGKLLFDPHSGTLLGTASSGGNLAGVCSNKGCGTVFIVNTLTDKERVLYAFTGLTDGRNPQSGLLAVPEKNGSVNLVGTTLSGGDNNGCFSKGCGTVFEVSVSPAQLEQ